jgi:hypothetical protein
MPPRIIAFACSAYVIPLLVTALLLPSSRQDSSLPFIFGGIIGSQVASYAHWRVSPEQPSRRATLVLGLWFAATAVVAGLVWQALASPFRYPDIIIPLSALGSFLFPTFMVPQAWKYLGPMPRKRDEK